MSDTHDPDLSIDAIDWFRANIDSRLPAGRLISPLVRRWLFRPAEAAYRQFLESEGPFFPAALRTLRLKYRYLPEELSRIPRTGPVIVVANHPYGAGVELVVAGAMLTDIRPDFRIVATSEAMLIPPAREFVIPLSRLRDQRPVDANRRSIYAAVQWLRSGGLVLVFPAGRVATRPFPTFKLTEQPWTDIAAVLARWSGAAIVPMYFHGCNYWVHYAASLLHHDLRHLARIWELPRRKPRVVRVSIGTSFHPQPLIEESGLKHATSYLRSRTLGLCIL